jgi:hypothetical protein
MTRKPLIGGRRFQAIGLASLGLLMLPALEARACGTLLRCDEVLLPRDGARISSHVPAFLVARDTTSASLLDPLGQPVAFEIGNDEHGYRLLRPAVPLIAGTYVLGAQHASCTETTVSRIEVTTTPPAPPSTGQVIPKRRERRTVTMFDGYSCGPVKVEAMVVPLDLRLSTNLEGFLPVARLYLRIDGKVWRGVAPANLDEARTDGSYRIDEVFTPCGASASEHAFWGLRPGRHRGSLSVEIPGADTQPAPAEFDLDIDCADPTPVPPARDTGTTMSPPGAASGCSVAPSDRRGAGSLASFMLLGAVALTCALRRCRGNRV